MHDFLWLFFLCALFSYFLRLFLPEGSASPLFPPLNFLFSAVTLLVVFLFLFSFGENGAVGPLPSLEEIPTFDNSVHEEFITKKNEESIQLALEKTFPENQIKVFLILDENNVPSSIDVFCDEEISARITAFLYKNYGLNANVKGDIYDMEQKEN